MMTKVEPGPDETLDAALGGKVRIFQPAKGFRFSVDAILLARFAAQAKVERAVDLGCGCGVAGLCLLALNGAESLSGMEIQRPLVDMAKRNADLNALSDRAAFFCFDLGDFKRGMPVRRADLVIANPPYRSLSSTRLSPEPTVNISKCEVKGNFLLFSQAAAELLTKGGRYASVYPAERLGYALESLSAAELTPIRLRFLHPRQGEPASLILLEGIKKGKGSLTVEAPLFLHCEKGSDRKYSEEALTLLGCEGV